MADAETGVRTHRLDIVRRAGAEAGRSGRRRTQCGRTGASAKNGLDERRLLRGRGDVQFRGLVLGGKDIGPGSIAPQCARVRDRTGWRRQRGEVLDDVNESPSDRQSQKTVMDVPLHSRDHLEGNLPEEGKGWNNARNAIRAAEGRASTNGAGDHAKPWGRRGRGRDSGR